MLVWLAALAAAVPQPELRLHLGKVPMKGRTICYPSGLSVHAVARPNTGVVAVSAIVDGGMAAEEPNETGASRLAQQLWFQARAVGGVPVEQTLSGLAHDAFTLPDATVFVTVAAPTDLEHVLQIEGRRIAEPLAGIDAAVFDAERSKVRVDTLWHGEQAAQRALEDGLWPEAFVYRGLAAQVADYDALTMEQVAAYVARTYVPSSITIRIEGEVDLATIDSVVEAAIPVELRLGADKGDCVHPAVGGDPPAPTGGPPAQVTAGVLVPELSFGWSVPAGYGPTDVIGRAAAGWLTIRLGAALRPHGLDVACAYEPRRRASVVTCRTPLPGAADEATAAIGVALRDLWVDDLAASDAWVEEMVGALDGALASADSFSNQALAERALFSHFSGGKFDAMTDALESVLAFREDELVAFGRRHLNAARMVSVTIVPGEVPAAERSGRIEALAGLGAPKAAPWAVPEPVFDGWRARALPNGLDLWVVPRSGGSPLSEVALAFDRGASVGVPGAAVALERGWDTRVPLSFAELLDKTSTRTSTTIGPVDTRVSAEGPSGNLDAQLYLVRQLVVAPAVRPEPVVDAPLAPDARAALDRMGRLFPGHPLARTPVTTAKKRDVAAWRAGVLRPERGALVVAGWVDPAEADALAETYLGGWTGGSGEPLTLPPPPEPEGRAVHGVRAASTLASVSVACRLPPRTPENDAALDVVTFLLDQGMRQSLQAKGGTYVADAVSVDLGAMGGAIELRTAVGPGEAGDALSAMYGLIELVSAGPPEEVLQWAHRAVRSEFARSLASTRSTFERVVAASASSMTLDQLRSYPSRVDAVDADAVRAALSVCLDREAATYVGPPADLAPYEPVWLE